MRKKIVIAMTFNSLLLLALIFIWPFFKPTRRGEVQIFNRSTEQIAKSSVKVCGRTIEHSNIPVGGVEKGEFLVDCDGSFVVEAELASGKIFSHETSGTLKGFSYFSQLDVTDAEMELVHFSRR